MEKINNNPQQELKKLRWERDFSHNWNILKSQDILKEMTKLTLNSKEDEEESLIKQKNINQSSLMNSNINFNFNFLRNLIIVIDMSDNLNAVDYKPNRHKHFFKELECFINEYFKYNIASTIVILANRDYTTQLISPFSNNPIQIIQNLNQDLKPEGSFSITNSLKTCLECINANKKMNNDIMLICASPISFDRENILSVLSEISHHQVEISILSFEIPMGILYTISALTKAVVVHPTKSEDISDFLTYMVYKRAVRETIKLGLAGCLMLNEYHLICSCHHFLCSLVYTCKICNDHYCSLPAYCRHCNTLNINSALVYQLKQGYVREKEHKCFPYKLSTYYNSNINSKQYQDFFDFAVKQLLSSNKKDFLKAFAVNSNCQNAENDRIMPIIQLNDVHLSFQIKLLLLYLRYQSKQSSQFNNLMKVIHVNQLIEDYFNDNKIFLLTDWFVCSGCDARFTIKIADDLTRLFVYEKCFDIFCEECYQYIYDNDLGCLACD